MKAATFSSRISCLHAAAAAPAKSLEPHVHYKVPASALTQHWAVNGTKTTWSDCREILMQIRQSLFQLPQFPLCLFQVTLKDANWERSMEARPYQRRCLLSEISLCPMKPWSGDMQLQTAYKLMFASNTILENTRFWETPCMCERYLRAASHFFGTRSERQGLESPCVSAPRPTASRGAARDRSDISVVKMQRESRKNPPMCCKDVRAAYQIHCFAASCFSTWLFVSAPDDGNRGASESVGEWKR